MRDTLSFYESTPPKRPVRIISVPTELGSDARGLSRTPAYLREEGLDEMLAAIGAVRAPDIAIPSPAPADSGEAVKNLSAIAALSGAIADAVRASAERDEMPLVIGGDHTVSIGSIHGAGMARQPLGVVWTDAHPDVHTHETSASKNAHGMPAALAMGFGHPLLVGEARAAVAPEHFLFAGTKDFDAAEIAFLREKKPQVVTMHDIDRHGLAPLFAAIEELAKQVERVWVTLDIDSIDRLYAPGVAMQNTGGFTEREILALTRHIGKTCTLAGIDVVEMLPTHDLGGKTAALVLDLIARLLGSEYSPYREYMTQYD